MTILSKKTKRNIIWLLIAFIVYAVVAFIPTPEGLTVVGQRALATFAFAIIVWVSQAVSYPVSSMIIIALIALGVGFAPNPEDATALYGTSTALRDALAGLATPGFALVAAALFIAAAMQITGLHKRIALLVMSKIGTKVSSLVLGVIIVSTTLAFFVPSATARAGALAPIVLGIVAAVGGTVGGNLSGLLMIVAVQSISFWNIGIRTAAAQNMVALDFMSSEWAVEVTWLEWFIAGAPWAIIMCIVLYFLAPKIIKVDQGKLAGEKGAEVIKEQLTDLGEMSSGEKKLAIYVIILLIVWVTEGFLHPIDANTITVAIFALMLLPKIGVFTWQEVQERTNWGTIIVFGIGISLGTLLLNSGGASWLSENTLGAMGLENMNYVIVVAILGAINILIHLGFASATSLASAFIPIVLTLVAGMGDTGVNPVGMVLIQQFFISFGFMLPVNAPQNMLAYGTGGYNGQQLLKVGVPITIIGWLLMVLMSATYWPWIGLL